VLQVKSCNAKAISRCSEKFSIVTFFVTLGGRPSAMVVRQREPPGSSEGVRTMVGSTAGRPGVRIAFRFAYVARTMNNPRQMEESVR
jgi:hypothetical protein